MRMALWDPVPFFPSTVELVLLAFGLLAKIKSKQANSLHTGTI